jgi:hypothetical protein
LYELDQSGAGDLGRDQRAVLLEVLVQGLAGASRVRLDRRAADAGLGREVWQHRAEGDVQAGAVGLVLGVARDEALGGFGAGVPAAEG